jgi:hypothetical protein
MHLPEVGSELGLLVAATSHILVGGYELPPGFESCRSRTLDGGASGLPLFDPNLLVETKS